MPTPWARAAIRTSSTNRLGSASDPDLLAGNCQAVLAAFRRFPALPVEPALAQIANASRATHRGQGIDEDTVVAYFKSLPDDPRVRAEVLVNLLKHPSIVGRPQAEVIRRMGKQVNKDFDGNLWKAIADEPYASLAKTPLEGLSGGE